MKFIINNTCVWVPQTQSNYSLIQINEQIGEFVPRFCFHQNLSIAGNCRTCLVELNHVLKPQVSCALPFFPDIKIFSTSSLVARARESVVEFILANHPLDCPICDQGGECDLQEQSLNFGSELNRFYFYKHSLIDAIWGSLIKIVMQRCILCTRCIRFSLLFAGAALVGTANRGSKGEIVTYVDKPFFLETSGGEVDLCPVGDGPKYKNLLGHLEDTPMNKIKKQFNSTPQDYKVLNLLLFSEKKDCLVSFTDKLSNLLIYDPSNNEKVTTYFSDFSKSQFFCNYCIYGLFNISITLNFLCSRMDPEIEIANIELI